MTKRKESSCSNRNWWACHRSVQGHIHICSQYHNTHIHQNSGEAAVRLQRVLWATFTAKHLPTLVDRILDLPPHDARTAGDYPIRNIYHTTLKFTDIAYLAKFMSSSHKVAEGTSYLKRMRSFGVVESTSYLEQGGKRLTRVIAERLVEFGPIWLKRGQKQPIPYDIYEGSIHKAVTTLMMLVIAVKGQAIPKTTKAKLLRWLDTWAAFDSWSHMTPQDNMPSACRTLSNVLKYGDNRLKLMVKDRRRALQCIEVCALPTCTAETNLKTCAKCAYICGMFITQSILT